MLDLVLLHPPSVYDFRRLSVLHGPISDVIPSTPIFEMYPIGFASLSEYLDRHGYKARIINIALKMLRSKEYDAEREIERLRTRAFGIDLHWMPHIQGAIALAELVKKYHPRTPVIFGGLSSTYYHRELLEKYEAIDFVVRGDSTEEPLRQLLESIRKGEAPVHVPNVTFRHDGDIVENPVSFLPNDLDYTNIDYRHIIRKVTRFRDFYGYIPFTNWPRYPITAIFTCRGCTYNCKTCGGSHYAFKGMMGRQRPAYKSPHLLVKEIRDVASHLKGPIFVIGDLFQGDASYGEDILALLKKEQITNHFVFEFFRPPSREHVKMMAQSTANFNVEISPESHDEKVRHAFGRPYTNKSMETLIESLIEYGCKRIDLFFMVGLQYQDYRSVMKTVTYCDDLLKEVGKSKVVTPFVSPLAPFVDPGSMVFESPEEYGYRLFFRDAESHRQAMLQPSWKYFLNYETEWLKRDQIVEATYQAALNLNAVKMEHGLISHGTFSRIQNRILFSIETMEKIDAILETDEGGREQRLADLRIDVERNIDTIGEKKELEWPTGIFRMNFLNILKTIMGR